MMTDTIDVTSREVNYSNMLRRYHLRSLQLASEAGTNPSTWLEATIAQVHGDTCTVMKTLWGKAKGMSLADPYGDFFEYASRTFAAMAGALSLDDTSARGGVEALRAAWLIALEPLNVAVSFNPSAHLNDAPAMNIGEFVDTSFGELSGAEYVEALAESDFTPGSWEAAQSGIISYLVKFAGASGDDPMLTVMSRWPMIAAGAAKGEGAASLIQSAHDVLGPVEGHRLDRELVAFGCVDPKA